MREEPNHTTTRKHLIISGVDTYLFRHCSVLVVPAIECLPRYRVSPGSNPDTPTPGLQATNPWSFVVETPVSCRAPRSQLQVIIALSCFF